MSKQQNKTKTLLKFGNSKLKKDGIASWSLPAIISCPQANQCKIGCYATQSFFNMPSVKKSYAENFALAKNSKEFFKQMNNELQSSNNIKTIRIHASGDFFNQQYLLVWVKLAQLNPTKQFYAYTKSVLLVKNAMQDFIQCGAQWPKNLTIIFSQGGKQDHLISENNDRHAKIFDSIEELNAAGYADVTSHDIGAMGPNHKIGLVYHGSEKRRFNTK